jgi:hypothetical protein
MTIKKRHIFIAALGAAVALLVSMFFSKKYWITIDNRVDDDDDPRVIDA